MSAVAFIIPVHMIDCQCHDFSFMQFDLFSAKVSINNVSGVKIASKYQLSSVGTVLFPCLFGMLTNYIIITYFFVIFWLQTNVTKNDHFIT